MTFKHEASDNFFCKHGIALCATMTLERIMVLPSSHSPSVIKPSQAMRAALSELLEAIDDAMPVKRLRLNILLPFDKLGEAAPIRERGTIYEEEYTADGLRLDFSAEMPIAAPLKKYALE